MRVLVGHTSRIPELLESHPLPGREGSGDEYLSFGFSNPQIPYHKGMTWREIRALCPQGWTPDLYLHWSPEYNPVPLGMEEADCLTVGVFGDWNLGGQAIQAVGSCFDLLIADSVGTEHLKRLGFPNTIPALLWAYDPELHRTLPHTERDIDVLMIGNFNHAVQQERSLWLARVARLAEQHHVVLTSGVFGEEYVRMMNRAKIVFNRSIRGEMNMRAYEAPACGAMLFYERENAEIGQVFRDRKECILYGEDDLEALLAHYLSPENRAERERITQNGTAKVASHSYAHHFASLLTSIEAHPTFQSSLKTSSSEAFAKRKKKNATGIAQQWITTFEASLIPAWEQIRQEFMNEATSPKERAKAWGLQGTRLATEAWLLPACSQRDQLLRSALRCLELALEENPDHALLKVNLAYVSLLQGKLEEAEGLLRGCLERLETSVLNAETWDTVLFPRQFDYYLVQMERERVWGAPCSMEGEANLRRLLRSKIALTLAEITFQNTDFSHSLHYGCYALSTTPENPAVHHQLAKTYRALGSSEEALTHYHKLLCLAPFEMKAWEECSQLLLDLGRFEEASSLLDSLLALLKGSPFYASHRTWALKIRNQAEQMRSQPQPLSNLSCTIAFPEWEEESDWQSILRHYAESSCASDPTLLLLRADPARYPNAPSLLQQAHRYLTETLRLSPTNLPRITLLNSALNSDDLWKVFHIAHFCLATHELPPLHSLLAQNLGVQVLPVERFVINEREAQLVAPIGVV